MSDSGLGVCPKPTTIRDWAEHHQLRHSCHNAHSNVRSCQEFRPSLLTNQTGRSNLPPRLALRLTLLVVAACGPARSSAPEPARCGPSVPETAQHPIAVPASALAGDYELVQVQTQPSGGTTIRARLHLAPLDSSTKASAAGGAVRDLIGWLETPLADSTGPRATPSGNPSRTVVVLAGQRLRVGQSVALSGAIHNLEITAVAPEGFWGWWKADRGLALTEAESRRILPDPAGYFCALRLER